ncbi:hypothetical protein V494_04069 [Pseudogymnoascus sp. VKM F-4513 (FW-928)]|nr:hypothetical protein V494_04069 [Pseudogymnoascus sp. VKM F-4513 (FW-928)]
MFPSSPALLVSGLKPSGVASSFQSMLRSQSSFELGEERALPGIESFLWVAAFAALPIVRRQSRAQSIWPGNVPRPLGEAQTINGVSGAGALVLPKPPKPHTKCLAAPTAPTSPTTPGHPRPPSARADPLATTTESHPPGMAATKSPL